MGANAQTTVPTFSVSQVLTADQQNQSARTGVPVFATTATRDAAFGGSQKTLAEGQLCYVENLTGVAQIQYYDGSNWVSLTAGGLVRVSGETTFSAVSSVTIDSVFTSSYRNYKIFINYTTSTTAGPRVRLRAGGSSTSTATYNEQYLLGDNATASASRGASTTSIAIGGNTNGSFNSSIELTVYNPQIATPTTVFSSNMNSQGAYTTPITAVFGGNQTGSTSFDGIELLVSSGTITGNYSIYGLATT